MNQLCLTITYNTVDPPAEAYQNHQQSACHDYVDHLELQLNKGLCAKERSEPSEPSAPF